MQLAPLSEQVIVVLGATSGIGRITARLAAQRGARVVAVGRDEEALRTLEAEDHGPGVVDTFIADAADAEAMAAVAAHAVERFGRLDTWAHVAGISEFAPVEAMTAEEFRRIVDVDLLGPIYGYLAALPHLRERGGAYIVVSSEVARRAFPLQAAYSAAKHGVDGFVTAARLELEHDKVPVSVTEVLPATIATPFFEHARTRLGVRPTGPPPAYAPEKVAAVILDAAEHPKREAIVGGAGRVQLLLQRISPTVTDVLTKLTAFRSQQSSEPKQVDDGDALFDAPEGDDRVRGKVSTTSR